MVFTYIYDIIDDILIHKNIPSNISYRSLNMDNKMIVSPFVGSRTTQRILKCEETYGSPESPLSKMDILTVSE